MSFLRGLFGPPDVQRLEAKKDVEGLKKALAYKQQAQVRVAAAQALGRVGDRAEKPALTSALEDEDVQVRIAAAEALARAAGSSAVGALVKALGDPEVSPTAARLLSGMGDPAIKGLVGVLGDRKLGPPAADVLASFGASALDALLGIEDPCKRAIELLEKIGDARAIPFLAKKLGSKDAGVSAAAMQALAALGEPAWPTLVQRTRTLIGTLRGEPSNIITESHHALRALAGFGKPVQQELVACLSDPGLRENAAYVLNEIGWQPETDMLKAHFWIGRYKPELCVALGAQAVDPLIEALAYSGPHTRGAAARALAALADPRAIKPLAAATRDKDEKVRLAAADALGEFGAQAALELIDALNAGGGAEVVAALGKIADGRAVDALIAALRRVEPKVRANAAAALGKIGDPTAVGPLVSFPKDPDWGVRKAVFEALTLLRDERALPALLDGLGDYDHHVYGAAVAGLVEFGMPATSGLLRVLRGRDARERGSAAEAIAGICARLEDSALCAEAADAVAGVLKSEHVTVRWSGVEALGELIGKAADKSVRDRGFQLVLDALKDTDEWVRRGALGALGVVITQISDKALRDRGFRSVLDVLKDPDPSTRGGAARALGLIGDPLALDALLAVAQQDESARRDAEYAVARICGGATDVATCARAVDCLVSALGHRPWELRQEAARALSRLYREGGLDEAARQRILAHAQQMSKAHADSQKHSDNRNRPDTCVEFEHSDMVHSDEGIGVEL